MCHDADLLIIHHHYTAIDSFKNLLTVVNYVFQLTNI